MLCSAPDQCDAHALRAWHEPLVRPLVLCGAVPKNRQQASALPRASSGRRAANARRGGAQQRAASRLCGPWGLRRGLRALRQAARLVVYRGPRQRLCRASGVALVCDDPLLRRPSPRRCRRSGRGWTARRPSDCASLGMPVTRQSSAAAQGRTIRGAPAQAAVARRNVH